MGDVLRYALLVSGEGSTAAELRGRLATEPFPTECVLAVADRPCPAIARLGALGVPMQLVERRGAAPAEWASRLASTLLRANPAVVVLAGFLAVVPPEVLGRFAGRVINVHPSLLPAHGGPGMYGRHVHAAVLAGGDRRTGATVHVVTASLDDGPVLWQSSIAVAPARTPEELRDRVLPLEIEGLVAVLGRYARGELPDAAGSAGRGAGAAAPG